MVRATVSKARTDQEEVKEKRYRCSISEKMARQLGKSRKGHVRLESDTLNAYYVVEEIHEDGSADFRTSKRGCERVGMKPGDEVQLSSTVPLENKDEAFPRGDIAETFWHQNGAEVFISCPHGGDVEYNTDEIGQYLFKQLLGQGIPSTFWGLHGYYSPDGKNATRRWHVSKPVKAYDAYPGLKQLKEKNLSFRYGIGFHIQKADHVGVGGMADREVREMIAEGIRGPVPSKYDVITDYEEMKLTGKGTIMSMNHLVEDYQGIQIEMPYKVAYNKFHSLPEAVADTLFKLL